MVKKCSTVFILATFLAGCSLFLPPEPWSDEYFVTSNFDGHKGVSCSNEEAKRIASEAIRSEYPELYDDFVEKGFSLYAPIYGNYSGKKVSRYTYKSILGYKKIAHHLQAGSYYEKSIEVSLSQDCKVLGVDYFKGKIEYVI